MDRLSLTVFYWSSGAGRERPVPADEIPESFRRRDPHVSYN